jgi:hypothetical protein
MKIDREVWWIFNYLPSGSTRYCVAGLLQARQESMVLDTRFPAGMTSYLDIFAYNDEAAPLGTGFVVNNRL